MILATIKAENEPFPTNGAIGCRTFIFNASGSTTPFCHAVAFASFLKPNFRSNSEITGPPSDGIHELQQRIAKLVGDTKLADLELHPIDDLHMSLTKTVVLRHHWINEFVRTAEHHLKSATK